MHSCFIYIPPSSFLPDLLPSRVAVQVTVAVRANQSFGHDGCLLCVSFALLHNWEWTKREMERTVEEEEERWETFSFHFPLLDMFSYVPWYGTHLAQAYSTYLLNDLLLLLLLGAFHDKIAHDGLTMSDHMLFGSVVATILIIVVTAQVRIRNYFVFVFNSSLSYLFRLLWTRPIGRYSITSPSGAAWSSTSPSSSSTTTYSTVPTWDLSLWWRNITFNIFTFEITVWLMVTFRPWATTHSGSRAW